MDGVCTVADCPIFEDVGHDAVEALCARGRPLAFESGHMLFERGQSADELMILRRGTVELLIPVQILGVTRDVTMESRRPGDVVAWSALVRPYHFTLSARCVSPCTLLALSRDDLHTYFESDPATGYLFLRNLAGVIGRRLQSMQTLWMHDLQATALRRFG